MNIKPNKASTRDYAKGGVRNYAEGGLVDDPLRYVQGSTGGAPDVVGVAPDVGEKLRIPPTSREEQAEFNAMTPDKLYPGTGYARRWKKLSPNG